MALGPPKGKYSGPGLQREPQGQLHQMIHVGLFAPLLDIVQSLHHGSCVCTAMPLSQVPQVDRELVQLVVTKVPMGQDAIEEGEAQQALAL